MKGFWVWVVCVNGLLLLHCSACLPTVGPEPVPSWPRSSPQLVCDACDDGLSGPQLFFASCPGSATFFFYNSCQSQQQVSPVWVLAPELTDSCEVTRVSPDPHPLLLPPTCGTSFATTLVAVLPTN